MHAFSIPHDGPHGPTQDSENPKLDAYKQAAYLNRIGRRYSLVFHEDGAVTVQGVGLMPITFKPAVSSPVS